MIVDGAAVEAGGFPNRVVAGVPEGVVEAPPNMLVVFGLAGVDVVPDVPKALGLNPLVLVLVPAFWPRFPKLVPLLKPPPKSEVVAAG